MSTYKERLEQLRSGEAQLEEPQSFKQRAAASIRTAKTIQPQRTTYTVPFRDNTLGNAVARGTRALAQANPQSGSQYRSRLNALRSGQENVQNNTTYTPRFTTGATQSAVIGASDISRAAGESSRLLNMDLQAERARYNALKNEWLDSDPVGAIFSHDEQRLAEVKERQQEMERLAEDIRAAEPLQTGRRYASYMDRPDFAEYAAQGAAIENPSLEDVAFRSKPVGNIVSFSRDNYLGLAASEANGARVVGNSRYIYMTDDEVDTYNYILAREGAESAQHYLDYLDDTLNYRAGAQQAENVSNIENPIGRAAATGLYAIGSGLEQFRTGVRQNFTDEVISPSDTQYAGALIREDLADTGPQVLGSSLGQIAFDTVSTISNMAPSVFVSSLLGWAGAPAMAAGLSSAGTFGLAAAGNAYGQALSEGYSKSEARIYSILTGASEGALQYLLGGISKLGGAATGRVAQTTIRNIDNALIRTAANLGINMAGEGLEEYLQTVLEPAYRNLVLGEDNTIQLVSEEAAYSFLLGAVTSGLLEGGYITSESINRRETGKAILDTGKRDELVNRALALDADTEAHRMAERFQSGERKDTAANLGELYAAYAKDGGDVSFLREAPAQDATQAAQRALEGESDEIPAARATRQGAVPDASQSRRQLEQAGQVMGESGRRALVTAYDGASDTAEYYAGFAAYYDAGMTGRAQDSVSTAYTSTLTPAQRYAAYTAGQNDSALPDTPSYTPTRREDAGLVRNDIAGSLTEEAAGRLDSLARATGVQIELVETMERNNGVYIPVQNRILIAMDADNPVDIVAAHEITHRLQDTAPAAYRAYRDYAINAVAAAQSADGWDVSSLIEDYIAFAGNRGVTLNIEQAMDEIAADFTKDMINHADLFGRLAQTHRSVARRVLDALKGFISRVKRLFRGKRAQDAAAIGQYGVDMATLENAARLWQNAYDETAVRQDTAQENETAVRQDGEVRFSIRKADGKNVVWIENSSLTNKELNNHKAVAEFIAQHIGEVYTIIESGQNVYIGPDLPGEYTQSRYTSYLRNTDRDRFRAKRKAVDGFGELIETATNRRWERTRHTHNKDAKYGMYRYDSTFAFPVKNGDGAVQRVRAYDAELLIRNASDGKKYLYDIVNVKENTAAQSDLTEREARSAAHKAATGRGASDTSIPEAGEDVNSYAAQVIVGNREEGNLLLYDIINLEPTEILENKTGTDYITKPQNGTGDRQSAPVSDDSIPESDENVNSHSLRGSDEVQRQNAALQRENAMLRERVEYWRGQMRPRTPGDVNRRAVNRAARELVEQFDANLDAREIAGDLYDLYRYIGTGREGDSELTYSEARRRANAIARQIVESAQDADTAYNQYGDLRKYLRSTKLRISEADSRNIPDYGAFRKSNFGRLNLSQGPTNIDSVYQEMAELWPEFFDEQTVTHPADQLAHIAEVADAIYNDRTRNPFAGYLSEAVVDVSNEILERFFDIPEVARTFADRANQRVENARESGRRQAERTREQRDRALEAMRQRNRERMERLKERERDTRERQINRLKEKYRAKDAAGRERQRARELRARIIRHTAELSRKLLRPTDNRHVPDALRKSVAAVLEAINQESAYSVNPDTGRRQRNRDGTPAKRTLAFENLREQYAKIAGNEGSQMVIDESLLGTDGVEGKFAQVIAMRDIPINEMSSEQLQIVWDVVRAVEKSLQTAGKMLSRAKYRTTTGQADAIMRDTRTRRAKRTLTKSGMSKSLEQPYTFFHHFGEAGMELFNILNDAELTEHARSREVREQVKRLLGDTDIRNLERHGTEFKVGQGEDAQALTLTPAHVMELYNLWKRPQARQHILEGGIVQPEIRGTKIRKGTDGVRLTEKDVANITGTLTNEQIKIADGLQKIMNTTLSGYGNEASRNVYGYSKFTEENYWPIYTSSLGLHYNVENSRGNDRSLKNIGLAKSTNPQAKNAIEVRGIFNDFATHSTEMLRYASWLAAMEDMTRLYNYRFRDREGNETDSVKRIFERAAGAGADAYFEKLMRDIQNGVGSKGDDAMVGAFAKGVGRYRGASVGANLRVVIQQLSALLRAPVGVPLDDFFKGIAGGVTRGNGWKKAVKYSVTAQMKQDSDFDISNTGGMKKFLYGDTSASGHIRKVGFAGARNMDKVVWGGIWNACEHTVASRYPDLRAGSPEFYEQVDRLFTDAINQSQVLDGVMQRANILRSSNDLARQATAYMGEPIVGLNIVMRAFDDYRYEQNSQARSRKRKKLARAIFFLATSNVINGLLQSFVDAIRDDDKEKDYWERYWAAFLGVDGNDTSTWDKMLTALGGNLASAVNPLEMIPFVRDIWSMVQGYDVARADMEAFSDIIQTTINLFKGMDGDGRQPVARLLISAVNAAAKALGVPTGNLLRDIEGMINTIAVESESIPLLYWMEKSRYNIHNEGNAGRFVDILYLAMKQEDTEAYENIYQDMVDNGISPEEIRSGMEDRMKAEQGVESVEDLEQRYLSPDQERAYDDMRRPVTRSALWKEASAKQRDSAEKILYNLAAENGAGKKLQEKLDSGAAYGIDETDYILYNLALSMCDEPNDNGNLGSYTEEEVYAAIEMLDLDDAASGWLWLAAGKSEKNNPYA